MTSKFFSVVEIEFFSLDKIPTNNSPFNESLAGSQKPMAGVFKQKNEKVTSPNNNQMVLGSLKTNSGSGSGSNKNLIGSTSSSQLTNQPFSSKVAAMESNLSSLKKNIDIGNIGSLGQTSHLKSNNTQNLAKGLSRLNDTRPQNDVPSFEKSNFGANTFGKYPAGGKFPTKEYK